MDNSFKIPELVYYRPPTKLRECNVFSRVCLSISLSTGGGGSHVTTTHDSLTLTVQGSPSHGTSKYRGPFGAAPDMGLPTSPRHGTLMYKDPLRHETSLYMYRDPHPLAVCILMECFLVHVKFYLKFHLKFRALR